MILLYDYQPIEFLNRRAGGSLTALWRSVRLDHTVKGADMPDLPSYAQLVERLGTFEYDVQPNAHGYLVSSRTDPSDVS